VPDLYAGINSNIHQALHALLIRCCCCKVDVGVAGHGAPYQLTADPAAADELMWVLLRCCAAPEIDCGAASATVKHSAQVHDEAADTWQVELLQLLTVLPTATLCTAGRSCAAVYSPKVLIQHAWNKLTRLQ
jgi:hypothetical protein